MEIERRTNILNYLREHKRASVTELSTTLFVSPATIRRDLTEMQKQGQVERSHGGVMLTEASSETSIYARLAKNASLKTHVASIAIRHIPTDFQSIFIDNSSTCFELASKMDLSHKTIVTNGLFLAMQISHKYDNISLIMPGGEVGYNTNSVSGSMTVKMLQNFKFDLMLSSCAFLDDDNTYEVSLDAATIKQAAASNSKHHILLADSSKFGKTAIAAVRSLTDYNAIYTDATDEQIASLKKKGIHIINH